MGRDVLNVATFVLGVIELKKINKSKHRNPSKPFAQPRPQTQKKKS